MRIELIVDDDQAERIAQQVRDKVAKVAKWEAAGVRGEAWLAILVSDATVSVRVVPHSTSLAQPETVLTLTVTDLQ